MTVKELIAMLAKLDGNARVHVWNAYHDCETERVFVEPQPNGTVLITSKARGW